MITRFPSNSVPAPQAPRRRVTSHWHQHQRQDHYSWLEADDWLSVIDDSTNLSKEIHAHLTLENQYAKRVMSETLDLQQALTREIRGRVVEDESSVPEKDGPYFYRWCYQVNAEHPRLMRYPDNRPEEEQVVMDFDAEAAKYRYFELGDYEVSPDHRWLFWTVDDTGNELYTLRFRNLDSGKELTKKIPRVDSATWINDQYILYVRINDQHRAHQVFRHNLANTDAEGDSCVLEEFDDAFDLCVGRMRSGRYVEIVASAEDQDEVHLLAVDNPTSAPILFTARQLGLEYSVDHQLRSDGTDRFILLTNTGEATNFRIMTTDSIGVDPSHWEELVAESTDYLIECVDTYKDWIIWMLGGHVHGLVRWMDRSGNITTLPVDEVCYEIDISPSPEFDASALRVTIESPRLPPTTYDVDLASGLKTLLKTTEIPSGHDPEHYECRRLWAKSSDGVEVPITCLFRRDLQPNPQAAGVIEAYGSYGSSLLADFCPDRLSLVDRGMIIALAHVRGGQEMGRQWYHQAKGAEKQNTFADFIACSKLLIDEGWVSSSRLVCVGRSAGGLLVGAVLNQAPELYAGAVADVPFVDTLATLLDETHPLTPGEWPQWGNPIEDPQAYAVIAAYSPVDNVKPQAYPPIYVTAGLSDPRVAYWEPAKWVAELRHHKTDDNPVLLITNMSTGHSGAPGRFGSIPEIAREYAFILTASQSQIPATLSE